MSDLNKGINVDAYNGFKAKVLKDPKAADIDKTAVAHWVQDLETRINVGDVEVTLNTDDGMNNMEIILAALASCNAGMVALHASFMGLKVNSVTTEMNAHFNVAAALVGIEDAPPSGYDRISAKITVDAPDATPEQIATLKHICETGSPVGNTFSRNVPIDMEIILE